MSLEYNILSNKPKKTIVDDTNKSVEMYDLLVPIYNYSYEVLGRPVVVNAHYVARPDLISLAFYGDDKYTDILCKVNGISNPFELNENDIIYLPDLETLQSLIEPSQKIPFEEISDNQILNYKKTYKKTVNEKRAPNEQTINDDTFIIDKTNNLVFY